SSVGQRRSPALPIPLLIQQPRAEPRLVQLQVPRVNPIRPMGRTPWSRQCLVRSAGCRCLKQSFSTAVRQPSRRQSLASVAPIPCCPDGSCTEASMVLKNDQDQVLRLTLRGLTGVGRASQVLGRDELQRTSRQ